jgi:RNA polymerase sigma-70 factor (ECF subfamily)
MTYETAGDAEVVAACRAGDQDAWRELVRRFSRYVHAIATQAYRLGTEDAEDVFQEVFARAFERLSELRSDDAVRPWLAQLTRRLCIDRIRAGSRESADPEAIETGVEDSLDRLDEALSVQEAMLAMPDNCRDILDRFFRRDESYAVIGTALGLPSGTIASRISRCLAKLREQLEGREHARPTS